MMFRSLAMNKGFRRLAVPGSVVAAVLLTLFTGAAYSSAQAANSARSAPAGWYLALGDSVATGLQPGLGDDLRGGYVGHVLQALRASAPQTRCVT